MDIDLPFVLAETQELWEELREKTIFITGGTGFFGTHLLETLTYVNDQLNLGLHLLVLTRAPERFKQRHPRLAAHSAIEFIQGDVTDFRFPEKKCSYAIHAAAGTRVEANKTDPHGVFNTLESGTQRTLEFAKVAGVKKFLLLSSGAVYGRQPSDVSHIPETYPVQSDPLNSFLAYGQGKRAAERLCVQYTQEHGVETKIARCFAFVGPHLPLNGSFAIGNFIRDGLAHKPIQIQGDGTPFRSYLYTADLMAWLLRLLIKGKPGEAYNVGSSMAITIRDLAETVARFFNVNVAVAGGADPTKKPDRYVPDVTKIQRDLGLIQKISLQESIMRTVAWHRRLKKESV